MDPVLTLIEQQTNIGLPADADERDTFGAVLYEIGATALAEEAEDGEPNADTVTALWVIAGAVERVQQREAKADAAGA